MSVAVVKTVLTKIYNVIAVDLIASFARTKTDLTVAVFELLVKTA